MVSDLHEVLYIIVSNGNFIAFTGMTHSEVQRLFVRCKKIILMKHRGATRGRNQKSKWPEGPFIEISEIIEIRAQMDP